MGTSTLEKTSSFHWNTYGMMEYMLILYPSQQVNEKVLLEKQGFCQQYGIKPVIKALNRWIQNICQKQKGFELTLNNYSGFPPHTIYVRVQDPEPVITLINQLKVLDDFIRSSNCPPLKPSTKPYLTIARRLTMEVYEKAIKDYSRKDFHESFMVNELVLLKRSHQFDPCGVVNKFSFLPIHS